MKYRIYFRESYSEGTVLNTDDMKAAAHAYYTCIYANTYPRVSIDGRELKILEAERLFIHFYEGATGYQIRNETMKRNGRTNEQIQKYKNNNRRNHF